MAREGCSVLGRSNLGNRAYTKAARAEAYQTTMAVVATVSMSDQVGSSLRDRTM